MMLSKKTTGQAIRVKATEYNAIVDAVEDTETRQASDQAPTLPPEVELGKPVMVFGPNGLQP